MQTVLLSGTSEDVRPCATNATFIQTVSYLGEIVVLLGVSLQAQLVQQLVVPSFHYLIEDVKVSLPVILMHNPRLLQQVV